ncbi:MAG: EAL domain-containing protein (putative c-di-GMP-specific phosphodiesterase class I) [Granulosicoccus sp.]|jgi:EAL domain-containing protein (putative c-di-GMP-specific phosphodiesterase class I)
MLIKEGQVDMVNFDSSLEQSPSGTGHLLNSHVDAIRFMAGTRIFRQGELGDFAYMIETGYVEISSISGSKKHVIAVLSPGEIFGEMAILDGLPRSATASAMHETTVIPISGKQLRDELDRGSPVTRLILIAAINRLRTIQTKDYQDVESLTQCKQQHSIDETHIKLARINAGQQFKLRFDMEKAITQQQFTFDYQPIVSLADGRTTGFEALLRWPRPDGQVLMPLDFIPVAEQSGLIVPLGAWVLENALQTLAVIERSSRRRECEGPGIFISVNISARQLEREEDVEQLATLIENAAVAPGCVNLEITEQTLLINPRAAMIGLARLKSTGASIALDDFGTGYSSLNNLHYFPLDTLKIDRSFVDRIVDDKSRQRVVAAIINLARELDMDVVAEGVEHLDDAHWLREHACRYAQGHLIAKPAPLAKALSHLECEIEF